MVKQDFYIGQNLTPDNLTEAQDEMYNIEMRLPKIISRVNRFLTVPTSEFGKVKTNTIEILCEEIMINDLTYVPPMSFTNEFTEVGTDVLVIAYLDNDKLLVKQIDWTDDDYILLDGEVIIGGYHVGANRTYTDKGTCDANATLYVGIVEDSFWTPLFKPECDPRGMVYIGNDKWWDIYLNSMEWPNDKPKLVSKHDKVIATGAVSTVQHNNLCAYGLCWFDMAELFTNINKTFPDSTDYFLMCASQPLLPGYSYSEASIRNSAKYYVSNGICSSLNNYSLTDLFNVVGFRGGKSDAILEITWNWQQITAGHFLNGGITHRTNAYHDAYRHQTFGQNHLSDSTASSAFGAHHSLTSRYAYQGARGVAITQKH